MVGFIVFRSAAYRIFVLTTALLCLLSFANAEHFSPQNAKEVTHYSGDDDFICSRNASDDRSDMAHGDVVVAVLRPQYVIPSLEVLPALRQSYTLHNIRGPPATASLI